MVHINKSPGVDNCQGQRTIFLFRSCISSTPGERSLYNCLLDACHQALDPVDSLIMIVVCYLWSGIRIINLQVLITCQSQRTIYLFRFCISSTPGERSLYNCLLDACHQKLDPVDFFITIVVCYLWNGVCK